jgi:hypothetical protein
MSSSTAAIAEADNRAEYADNCLNDKEKNTSNMPLEELNNAVKIMIIIRKSI